MGTTQKRATKYSNGQVLALALAILFACCSVAVAIVAVLFALQNNVPVTISFFAWSFGGSLALVLLMALGLGVLIAGLVTSPALIGSQWSGKRLRRQVATLEEQNRALQQRVAELDAQLESLLAAQALAPTAALIEHQP